MSLNRQSVWAFAALSALSLGVLFWGLGAGRIHIYDEGLYGMYGRTLLRYGVYLHAVDIHGDFPAGIVKFSKPPLSVWVAAASMKVFGPSLFALRLPFALASFAVALLAFAFGRLLEAGSRGVWLGFAWG
ncbi:MAG TPA: glycosyltransferase family 39 protein, partial [Polyangiales bacterium]|nr:glycosyltransferase family 39 protein [Polyangiales bacterium]